MPGAAIMWIRDGVLVNRMHLNPVAFAFAYWFFTPPEKRSRLSIERLINFGFTKSGFSCADKMFLFNQENDNALSNVDAAASFYNELATAAAESCSYFDGAVSLLEDLQKAGVYSYITSAVEQEVLDRWAQSTQGKLISPKLMEILGRRPNFFKGTDHFEYVSDTVKPDVIYYVADAVSELLTVLANKERFKIVSVGFSYCIDKPQVMEAVRLVKETLARFPADAIPYSEDLQVDESKLQVPEEYQLAESLKGAGADHVAGGDANEIFPNLRKYFVEQGLLKQ
ncbi:MAG TPA: hypothetical protein EYN91_09500 [Candidatus Melainabacteria bacterium]|nr:hypothetical protein [Candidatus Melainabacteria bacterium]HIN67177.1 hypothetical protein [Candidatus Obscuribacterales bacterium]